MGTAAKTIQPLSRRPLSPSIFVNQNKPRPAVPHAHSDILIEVDGVGFALHKFTLSARSGRIKKLIKQYVGSDQLKLGLSNLPGGADAFELAAKFCYGIKFEINSLNVAGLYCIAEHLEMTEEYGKENLIACTELFLKEAVFGNLKGCVQVLCSCQSIQASSENVKLTRRCIDAIVSIVCNFYTQNGKEMQLGELMTNVDWWADELLPLPICFFQQVALAMKFKGLEHTRIAGALMHYAHVSLKSLNTIADENELMEPLSVVEHSQRIVMETIVNLLPTEKGVVPTSFLFRLLRTALSLDTTVACWMELEKRIGAQLEYSTLEELLVPSRLSHTGDTLFDVDLVHRLLIHFMQQDSSK